jgi:hypothetical protein
MSQAFRLANSAQLPLTTESHIAETMPEPALIRFIFKNRKLKSTIPYVGGIWQKNIRIFSKKV